MRYVFSCRDFIWICFEAFVCECVLNITHLVESERALWWVKSQFHLSCSLQQEGRRMSKRGTHKRMKGELRERWKYILSSCGRGLGRTPQSVWKVKRTVSALLLHFSCVSQVSTWWNLPLRTSAQQNVKLSYFGFMLNFFVEHKTFVKSAAG